MKLVPGLVLLGITLSATAARAGDDDTPAVKAAKQWVGAMLAPGGGVAAPSKDKPLAYIVVNGTRSCKALRTGTAKDFKVLAKLKKCLVDTHKGLSESPLSVDAAQWFDEGEPLDLKTIADLFGKKYAKKIKATGKDARIVYAHFSGDGVNMDWYLVYGADDHVKALWISEDFFE